jgi:hypothetical protein
MEGAGQKSSPGRQIFLGGAAAPPYREEICPVPRDGKVDLISLTGAAIRP